MPLLRVRGSYLGWLRLVILAACAMTMKKSDISCGSEGIACKQLGAH